MIKKNPKILCGYSDPTSILDIIHEKTGLVTFYGPNFKSLCNEETDYGYRQVIKRFLEKDTNLREETDEFKIIKEGTAEGELIRWKFMPIFKLNLWKIHSKHKRENFIYRGPWI